MRRLLNYKAEDAKWMYEQIEASAPIYEVLPRNEEVIIALVDLIRAFSDTYKEILYVMLFLWQRGVPIAWDGLGTPPVALTPPVGS